MIFLTTTFHRFLNSVGKSWWACTILSGCYRLARRFQDEEKARKTLYRLACLLTLDFHRREAVVNLRTTKLYWRALHRANRLPVINQALPRWSSANPIKVGIFGMISSTLLTQEPFFRHVPAEIELHVFDISFRGSNSGYLAQRAASYQCFAGGEIIDHLGEEEKIAHAINAAKLDVVINIDYLLRSFRVIDRLETPCIIHLCSGSDLFHHNKISIQWLVQMEAEYFPLNERMFCARSRSYFSDDWVHQGPAVYDLRSEVPITSQAWRQRENLIFWHGSLYKLASSPACLTLLFQLLKDDSSLEFAFMGREDPGRWGLENILSIARRMGVENRAHYLGRPIINRGTDGNIVVSEWEKAYSLLLRARLWPDTWPTPGGAARVEAYAAGLPSIHMGVRFDKASWGKRQWNHVELPALLVPEATAWTPQEYQDLCRRCIYDETFADALAGHQQLVAAEAGNSEGFWKSLQALYNEWHARKIDDPKAEA